jgi:predicted transcriptional regulator
MGQFLSPATRAALDRLAALDDAEAGEPLELVRDIRSLIAQLDADPATLAGVRTAVAAGATWEDVAVAAGLKPAAVRWRWQGTDEEIQTRHEAGRKRSTRPSSVPTDLPGHSVSELAEKLGVTPQAIYLQVRRGTLASRVVELADGRRYKRVFPEEQ